MSRISRQVSSSSEDSFGWVDMEETESSQVKKTNSSVDKVSETEDSSEDSDSTNFDAEYNNEPIVNNMSDHKCVPRRNVTTTVKEAPGRSDRVPVTIHNKTSESSASEETSSESDGSDKKDLKPFTKKLIVKKERHSHTLSDDSNIDPSSVKDNLRVKLEQEKGDKSVLLIQGALVDSAQPLAFDIGDNEDVWIVQCPIEVTESKLKGKTLNFSGFTYAEEFQGNVLLTESDPQPLNILLPKFPGKIFNVKPSGHIVFKEEVVTPQVCQPAYDERNITSLPAGLKTRHPLFGTDVSLVQGLCSPPPKRKKKKKHNIIDSGNKMHMTKTEMADAENNREFDDKLDVVLEQKKLKKKKKQLVYEQTIGNTSDQNVENDENSVHELNSYFDEAVQSEPPRKKHKKCKRESTEATSQEISYFPTEIECNISPERKKHKHLEDANETGKALWVENSNEMENLSSRKSKKNKYEYGDNVLSGPRAKSERAHFRSEKLVPNVEATSLQKKKPCKYEGGIHSEQVKQVAKHSLDDLNECSASQSHSSLKSSTISDNFSESVFVNSSIDTPYIMKKKKKKKKRKQENEDSTFSDIYAKNENTDLSGEGLPATSSVISEKRRKHSKYEGDIHSEYVKHMKRHSSDELNERSGSEGVVVNTLMNMSCIVKKKKKIKQENTDFTNDCSGETHKKKKKVKIEYSDVQLTQASSGEVFTKSRIAEDGSCLNLYHFDDDRKKTHKKKKEV